MGSELTTLNLMQVAYLIGNKSKCLKKKVGAICLNEDQTEMVVGYNRVPSGCQYCTKCLSELYSDKSRCPAIHAEVNALCGAGGPFKAHTLIVTHQPCYACLRIAAYTTVRHIVFNKASNNPDFGFGDGGRAKFLKQVGIHEQEFIYVPAV